jgi:hypothetical protein
MQFVHSTNTQPGENIKYTYLSGELLPSLNSNSHGLDRSQRFTFKLIINVSSAQVVYNDNLVSLKDKLIIISTSANLYL